MDNNVKNQEDLNPLDISPSDSIISDPVQNSIINAFKGEYPFEVIMESINEQASNYLNLEDTESYVEIFYDQWHMSMKSVDNEEYPNECKEELYRILNEFYSQMASIFTTKFAITIMDLENDPIDDEQVEYTITLLYDFFIINGVKNLRKGIVHDIVDQVKYHWKQNPEIMQDVTTMNAWIEKELSGFISNMFNRYIPIITTIKPMDFLEYCNQNVLELYNDDHVNGNFFRKFNPKLSINEDLMVYITSDVLVELQIIALAKEFQ